MLPDDLEDDGDSSEEITLESDTGTEQLVQCLSPLLLFLQLDSKLCLLDLLRDIQILEDPHRSCRILITEYLNFHSSED